MSALTDKVNELSLLIVMSSSDDAESQRMILELFRELATLISSDPSHKRLAVAVDYVVAQNTKIDGATWNKLAQEFTTAAVAYVENASTVGFPNEAAVSVAGTETIGNAEHNGINDIRPNIEPSFLSEFIETHGSMLDDFEASILDFQFNPGGDGEELHAGVKRYLHNLKGDAGSIGLNGIERVCHIIEDKLVSERAGNMVPRLLLFREWATSWLKSLAAQQPISESSASFIARFHSGAPASIQKSAASPSAVDPKAELDRHAKNLPEPVGAEEYTLSGDREILTEFASEAEEHLNNVENLILESDGSFTKDNVDTIFRGVHSVKGGSAYFNLDEMTKTSHVLENLLHETRDGKRTFDQGLSDLVLSYTDLQKTLLGRARQALSADGKIKRCAESKQFLSALESYIRGENAALPTPTAKVEGNNPPAKSTIESETGDKNGDKLNVKNFVKIDTGRLDHLIDSIGEMVIYSSMLIRHCREHLEANEEVLNVSHRVEKFARDLQDIGMSMRLVPIKGLFQKMSRLVWDTAKKIGKEITFEMSGEDTELDRNLIDKLADPLMHMVRNALDHGVEPPDEREKKGKARTGRVVLSAAHSGGSIIIKIEDDGRGLDPEKLVAKATEKGVIEPGTKLTEQEIFQLIFAPGFSTAAVVTDISGRGVGMDVVRRNVEGLRGNIHIQSTVNRGSVFTIELPLTLAIIDGIEVRVGQEHFIIPSLSIVEFIRPKADMLSKTLDCGETFHFRGKYLPIFRLCDLYETEAQFQNPLDANFVIVQNNQELVAIMVDEILGEYSTVIKSLGPTFEGNRGVSGCAIMPSGDVALILDVRTLVQLARSVPLSRRAVAISQASQEGAGDAA